MEVTVLLCIEQPSLHFGTRAKFYCFLNTVFIMVENFGGIP